MTEASTTLLITSFCTLAVTVARMILDYFARRDDRRERLRVAEVLAEHTTRSTGEVVKKINENTVINVAAFSACQRFFGLGLMWATFWAIPPSTIVVFLLLNYRVFRAKQVER